MDSVADNFTPVQDTITGVDDLSATQQQPVPSVTTPGNAGGDPIGANETSSRDAEGVEQTENSKGAATMAQHNDGKPENNTSATAAAPTSESETLTVFHHVAAAITTGANSGTHVVCPICQDTQLSIRGLPLVTDLQATSDLKEGRLLLCGHMVCTPCWEGLQQANADSAQHNHGAPIICPVCRRWQLYPVCGHNHYPLPMPEHPEDPTVPESYRLCWSRLPALEQNEWVVQYGRGVGQVVCPGCETSWAMQRPAVV